MKIALIIAHLVISLILIVVVLLQRGKQEGLSGAISGGAETFFGKNKGRTVDAMLKRATSVVAILFIITSIALAYVASKEDTNTTETSIDNQQIEIPEDALGELTGEVVDEGEAGATGEGEAADENGGAEDETPVEGAEAE